MNFLEIDGIVIRKMYSFLLSDETFKLVGRQGAEKQEDILAVFCRQSIWQELQSFVINHPDRNHYHFDFTAIDLKFNMIGSGPIEEMDLDPFWILKRRILLNIIAVKERGEIAGILTDNGVQLCEPDQTPIKIIQTYPQIDCQYHEEGCILPREIGFKFCEILQ